VVSFNDGPGAVVGRLEETKSIFVMKSGYSSLEISKTSKIHGTPVGKSPKMRSVGVYF